MFERLIVVELPAAWTLLKLPAAMTVCPTWTMALILPSMMLGVKSAGLALTMAACGTAWARAGPASGSTRAEVRASRPRTTDGRRTRFNDTVFPQGARTGDRWANPPAAPSSCLAQCPLRTPRARIPTVQREGSTERPIGHHRG